MREFFCGFDLTRYLKSFEQPTGGVSQGTGIKPVESVQNRLFVFIVY